MIAGIGVDLVDIARARVMIEKRGEHAVRKVCSDAEAAYVMSRPDPAIHLAARIAAKEATFKALSGTADARSIGWKEMEVARGSHGEPVLRLHGRAAARAEVLGISRSWITLSHSAATACAVVILERDPAGGRSFD